MGKRSAFFASVLLIGGLAQLNLALAPAQTSTSDTLGYDCASGIYSSVDGNCMGADQSFGPRPARLPIGQQGSQIGGQPGGLTNGTGSSGQGLTAGQLSQQYPGLQSQGINGRVPNFYDPSGLPPSQAERAGARSGASLVRQRPSPPTEFQRLVNASLGACCRFMATRSFSWCPRHLLPCGKLPSPRTMLLVPEISW